MDEEEQKELILKNLGEAVKKVYGEWCSRSERSVGRDCVSAVVSGVDSALAHGLRRPLQGYWPLLTPLLDHDTHALLLQYPCPRSRGWQWVLRCLSRGELESLISVVLSHAHLLPPLYCGHALLRDPSAQLVLPTLLAGLEHVRLNKGTEEELEKVVEEVEDIAPSAVVRQKPSEGTSALRSLRSLRTSLLSGRAAKSKPAKERKTEPPDSQHDERVSPHFDLNAPQAQFPSLEAGMSGGVSVGSGGVSVFPPPRVTGPAALEPPFTSLVLSLEQLHEPPIDVCREATEDLNEQVFEEDDEAEMTVEVHHFGKRKKAERHHGSRGASRVEARASSGAMKDEAEAQEMSLEEELKAATQGGFVENRPPTNLLGGKGDDLIMGIVGDDKLVKVLPDPACGHVNGRHPGECDEYSADELDVEIVEAFPCSSARGIAPSSSPGREHSRPSSKKSAAISADEGSCSKKNIKPSHDGGSSKTRKEKDSSKSSGRVSQQQQLIEAKHLLKSLTKAGVIDVTPELNKLLDSLEQREALLSERSPPEGQEDPAVTSSASSLKKPASTKPKPSPAKTDFKDETSRPEDVEFITESKLDGYVSTSSGSMKKNSSTLVETSIGDDATDEERATSAEVLEEADEGESSHVPLDSSQCEDSLSDELVMSDEEVGGGDGSITDTDDNEEVSQLTTDADPSESRLGSCSVSSGSSGTDLGDLALRAGLLCASNDDLHVIGGALLRSSGVGLDTDDTSDGLLSDGESSTGAEQESGAESLPGIVLSSYQRHPLPLDESFCSLGDENLEEEALTEGCRGKTGIVGGAVWDQLMGGLPEAVISQDLKKEKNLKGKPAHLEETVEALINQTDGTLINFNQTDGTPVKSIVHSEVPDTVGLEKSESTNTVELGNFVSEGVVSVTNVSNVATSQKYVRDGSEGVMTQSAHSALSEAPGSDKVGVVGATMSRTLSLSSCGSRSGGLDGSRMDARSDGKLSSILDSKIDCKLDSTSESVVAALDDAAREAQLQLLNLHTQLQHYRKMALRRKTRKLLDSKLNPILKSSMLEFSIALTLPKALPVMVYPLKHSDAPVHDCPDCVVQQQWEDSSGDFISLSSITVIPNEATQNVLSSTVFRRPGERLYKIFIMRAGHAAGFANTVRVVLSSHALYVMTTCPAPSLLHALPYTQVHSLVLGAYREWVVVLSRAAVEWGSVEEKTSVGGCNVVGVQLCAADPSLALDFVASFELQTRRALMALQANEIKFSNEGKFLPIAGLDDGRDLEKLASRPVESRRLSGDVQTDPQGRAYDTRSFGSKASTPQEWWRPPVWRHGVGGQSDDFLSMSGRIERQVPAVVDAREWEPMVLSQWLQMLLPTEASTRVVGSWMVDWDGGMRLGQKGALGPTMEGPLMFRTAKLFSQWRNAHFLLKAGVLYQFWCSGDRLPHTMLDVTSCSACTPTTQHNKPHAFQVIQSDGSPLLLAASDADQAARWTSALSAVLCNAAGRMSTRRPLPCRLLLLPGSLVLLHQSDLLLAVPHGTPPPPHPTPSAASSAYMPSTVAPVDARRDSRSSGAALPTAVGTLRHSRHLSSSLSSLNSNSSAAPNKQNLKVNSPLSPAGTTAAGNGIGSAVTSTPNPPRSLALSAAGQQLPGYQPAVEGLAQCAPRVPLNRGAEARLVARLDLRSLASIGRYNECGNTTVLEVHSAFNAAWRPDELKTPLLESGGGTSGDWALYFRGSKQLENFLTVLASQVVVCERELCDISVQQLLLEGAQAAAGAWAAMASHG
ncbi:uncharacterized protein LOC108676550 isoform X2 [Hyalella azteca]|uniref:Uncharacterized protein LOC108676550 isoform X2 n=1 Tax=Hyalella azteca TaxID=294128 RepID=A0A8B7P4X6_HYAAZ|nr:uncharacterized protein LOC108676550 isoform X2 [Hyalella azteca]